MEKEYYHIPLITILIKLIFVIFFSVYSSQGTLHDANVYFFRPVDFFILLLGNHSLFNLGYTLREYFHLTYFNANLLLSMLPIIGIFLLLKCASEIYTGNIKSNNYHYFYILFFSLPFTFGVLDLQKKHLLFLVLVYFVIKFTKVKLLITQLFF